MARYSVTYRGTYGGYGAGTAGRDIELSGEAIPSEKLITSITYMLDMSASAYSSSQNWRMIEMTIEGSGIYADEDEISMGGSNRITLEGSLNFSRADISAFASGTFTLHTKANCTGSAKSFMNAVTITVNYKDVYAVSDTSVPSSVEAGNTIEISVSNPEISELYHDVICSFGTYKTTKRIPLGGTTVSISVPLDWCNAIPNSVSGTATVATNGYEADGTPVGSTTVTVTIEVPTSVKPSVGGVAAERISNGVPTDWGEVYVQNISGIKLTIGTCSGAYGSTIQSYVFGGAAASSGREKNCTVNPIDSSGKLAFTAKCVDSRGRESDEFLFQIDVLPYAVPAILGAMAYRCDSEGTSNEQGTYIRAEAAVSSSPCAKSDGTARNVITLKCLYQKVGDSTWKNGIESMIPGTFYTFGDGTVETTSTYQVKFVVSDAFKTVERIFTVSTSQYLLFFRRGGTAIGIGKKSRDDAQYVIDISEDWTVLYGNLNVTEIIKAMASAQIPDIVYSPTQPEAKAGRIWLKPKG